MCLACSIAENAYTKNEKQMDYSVNQDYNNQTYWGIKMETEELFFDEDMEQIEVMRSERKKMKDKDFAKLINKKDLSDFEMDEMFL